MLSALALGLGAITAAAAEKPVALIIAQGGLGDQSYNDLAYSGFKKALAEDKLEGKAVESKDVVAQAADILRRASDAGFGLIVDLEYSHGDALQAVAKDYSGTDYVILNQVRPGANVASVLFQEQEGSYLAGALATMVAMDTSIKGMTGKPVIGVIGGTKSVGIDKFIVGYIQGARDINPNAEVKVAYSNNFGDPAVGLQMAKAMFDAGANVVYQVAGGTGLGVIQAAKEAGRFAIGVDTDQDGIAPGSVLTSMVKRTDVAVETVMKDYADGKFPGGQDRNARPRAGRRRPLPDEIYARHDPGCDARQSRGSEEEDPLGRYQGLERRRPGLSGLLQVTETARVEVRLGARRVTRAFGPVLANDRVDLSVAPTTIHAVVGGNGAGKSTLMRILQGVDRPDEGSVILNDRPVRLTGPADAYARGIGMVHQEFMLAPPLTLLENLVLAREPVGFGGLIDWRAAQAEADRLAEIAGVTIDWRLRVVDAPVHVRQALEILRLLYRGADVLDPGRTDRGARARADRGPARADAQAEGGRANDPLHQPQARRGDEHRRCDHDHACGARC